jgi:cyclopropane fatty-acyl-phospholipid synthase-like methyltransferase
MTITDCQINFIKQEVARRHLKNIIPLCADINLFVGTPNSFDRIISIELLEYLLNFELLFEKLSTWLRTNGLLFVEFTTHCNTCYRATEVLVDYTGEGNYLSADILHYFQLHISLVDQWWVSGKHYAATFDAWLERMSVNRERMIALLLPRCANEQQAMIEYRKMELYLWISSEEYGFRDGDALGISHYLFQKV